MKFNLALIAAVATSSMLMSSVSAFTDCQASNRMDAAGGVTVTSVADCGANCLANSCQVATSFDATKDCVAEANLSGMQCDGNLAKCTNKNHEIVNGACVPTQALLDARTACDANLGKKLDEDTLVCACEHGDDNGVCKCSNHEQEVRDNNGTCTARPEVDCAKLNRGASIRQSGDKRAYLPEHCDVCTNTTHCMLPDGKCIAAPKDGKCENGKVVCNADFELKGESCEAKPTPPPANTGADKEEKKDEEESKDADKKNPKKEKTAEQKCKDLHRVFKDDKCGDCDGSRKAVSDGGMCYETVTEDKCKEKAKDTLRHFQDGLCVCDNGKKPEKENEESHLTAKCINGAGRLLVSSVVLLSSVAATAVFFL